MKAQKLPLPIFDGLENLEERTLEYAISTENATTDYLKARDFLYSYRGSSATFNSYRREIERLLEWCWYVEDKSLKQITRKEIEGFVKFCQNPPLLWVGVKNVSRFIEKEGLKVPNPEWKPFVVNISKEAHKKGEVPCSRNYTLSEKGIQAIFAILGSFFNFLIQEEYVFVNPVAQIRQKSKYLRKYQKSAPIRRLSVTQWAFVIQTAEKMAESNSKHERTLFIINALYGMYLRISELVATPRWTPQMGDFHKDFEGSWWFRTVGKGNKERVIAVSDAMLSSLSRYRKYLGLTPLPVPGEITPLISREKGKGPLTSTRNVRFLVQACFDKAISRMEFLGMKEEVDELRVATVHWLRHTGISDDVKIRPREHVRDDAGHGSSAITDKYIDIELRERHASSKDKKINPKSDLEKVK